MKFLSLFCIIVSLLAILAGAIVMRQTTVQQVRRCKQCLLSQKDAAWENSR